MAVAPSLMTGLIKSLSEFGMSYRRHGTPIC